jgi:hypothetical protein
MQLQIKYITNKTRLDSNTHEYAMVVLSLPYFSHSRNHSVTALIEYAGKSNLALGKDSSEDPRDMGAHA